MNQLQYKWHEVKGKVKEKWGKLTDNDLTEINGKFEVLAGKIQQKYGMRKEQAERELEAWCRTCECKACEHKKKAS